MDQSEYFKLPYSMSRCRFFYSYSVGRKISWAVGSLPVPVLQTMARFAVFTNNPWTQREKAQIGYVFLVNLCCGSDPTFFQVNPDPDQGFWWPQIGKKYSWNFLYIFFLSKIVSYLSPLMKGRRSRYRRSLQAPQKENPALQKMKFMNFALYFWVNFALLDLDPHQQHCMINSSLVRYWSSGAKYIWMLLQMKKRTYLWSFLMVTTCISSLVLAASSIWTWTGQNKSLTIRTGYFLWAHREANKCFQQ